MGMRLQLSLLLVETPGATSSCGGGEKKSCGPLSSDISGQFSIHSRTRRGPSLGFSGVDGPDLVTGGFVHSGNVDVAHAEAGHLMQHPVGQCRACDVQDVLHGLPTVTQWSMVASGQLLSEAGEVLTQCAAMVCIGDCP